MLQAPEGPRKTIDRDSDAGDCSRYPDAMCCTGAVGLMTKLLFCLLLSVSWQATRIVSAQTPENFRRENLVAWCIVPFDARQRSPVERTEMLKDLGLRHCAYDWRAKHVAEFEDEIVQYGKHGIKFVAFWDEHPAAFELFAKHGIAPQVWKTLTPNPDGAGQDEKVVSAAGALLPLAERTKQLGCRLGLYNHGGWGGEPENLVAVCQALRKQGFDHVGIVYNFHHGHGRIHDFESVLKQIQPWLLCLNLNGMVDLQDPRYQSDPGKYKILPIGDGEFEQKMIRVIIRSGYEGPIGILGHVADRDVAEVIRENIEGLERILDEFGGWNANRR